MAKKPDHPNLEPALELLGEIIQLAKRLPRDLAIVVKRSSTMAFPKVTDSRTVHEINRLLYGVKRRLGSQDDRIALAEYQFPDRLQESTDSFVQAFRSLVKNGRGRIRLAEDALKHVDALRNATEALEEDYDAQRSEMGLAVADSGSLDSDSTSSKSRSKRRSGRPPLSNKDKKFDKQLWEAWETGQYMTYKDLGAALGIDGNEADRRVDRERQRRRRAEKKQN